MNLSYKDGSILIFHHLPLIQLGNSNVILLAQILTQPTLNFHIVLCWLWCAVNARKIGILEVEDEGGWVSFHRCIKYVGGFTLVHALNFIGQ